MAVAATIIGISLYLFVPRQQYTHVIVKIEDPNFGESIYQKPTLEGKAVKLERIDAASTQEWKYAKGFSDHDGIIKYLPDLPIPSKWKISIWMNAKEYKELATYSLERNAHLYDHIIKIGTDGTITISMNRKNS